LALTAYQQKNYAQTVTYANQSLALARSLENKELEWQMLTLLGNAYYDQADYLKAVEIFRQAALFREHLGASAANLGRASLAVGGFLGAIEQSEYALGSGDPRTRAMALNTLATTTRLLGQNAKSLDYAQQALTTSQEVQENSLIQQAFLNLAESHQALDIPTKALDYAAQGLSLAQQLGDRGGEARARNTQGSILNEQADYPGAIAA